LARCGGYTGDLVIAFHPGMRIYSKGRLLTSPQVGTHILLT
jgi:hypothetical protein